MSKIKETRLAAGLSRQEVCDIIGIPYRTLQNWECDVRSPADWIENLVIAEIMRNKKNEA